MLKLNAESIRMLAGRLVLNRPDQALANLNLRYMPAGRLNLSTVLQTSQTNDLLSDRWLQQA